ncbi:hypothetical protein J2Z69_001594 [Paenibacillus shirakamiensis]|uniref:DUF4309 domain-containing protein n=1 Tax=Paenibacillus shirakamiensis TaxID=1265935 RepID=A0ABS4JFT0_9BACL|nr:YjgB family protein [Paenibacillus shirakamiensis]MBP2000563.1 hypothetical protein [Paenibacillus shirakamiensis]
MNQPRVKWISTVVLCLMLNTACSNQEASPSTNEPAPSKDTTQTSSPTAKPSQPQQSSPSSEATPDHLIQQIKAAADQGKVPDSEYAVKSGDWIEIQKQWGKPDHIEAAGKGRYATYTKRGISFGINKGEAIFDVRSYRENLRKITLSSVVDTMGKEMFQTTAPGQIILNYPAGDNFLLKFIFSKSTSEKPDPTLDHISIYNPQGAKNNMAG